LERDDGNGGDCDRLAYSGPETSAAVPGLRSGALYRFRLWAFNEVQYASLMDLLDATLIACPMIRLRRPHRSSDTATPISASSGVQKVPVLSVCTAMLWKFAASAFAR